MSSPTVWQKLRRRIGKNRRTYDIAESTDTNGDGVFLQKFARVPSSYCEYEKHNANGSLEHLMLQANGNIAPNVADSDGTDVVVDGTAVHIKDEHMTLPKRSQPGLDNGSKNESISRFQKGIPLNGQNLAPADGNTEINVAYDSIEFREASNEGQSSMQTEKIIDKPNCTETHKDDPRLTSEDTGIAAGKRRDAAKDPLPEIISSVPDDPILKAFSGNPSIVDDHIPMIDEEPGYSSVEDLACDPKLSKVNMVKPSANLKEETIDEKDGYSTIGQVKGENELNNCKPDPRHSDYEDIEIENGRIKKECSYEQEINVKNQEHSVAPVVAPPMLKPRAKNKSSEKVKPVEPKVENTESKQEEDTIVVHKEAENNAQSPLDEKRPLAELYASVSHKDNSKTDTAKDNSRTETAKDNSKTETTERVEIKENHENSIVEVTKPEKSKVAPTNPENNKVEATKVEAIETEEVQEKPENTPEVVTITEIVLKEPEEETKESSAQEVDEVDSAVCPPIPLRNYRSEKPKGDDNMNQSDTLNNCDFNLNNASYGENEIDIMQANRLENEPTHMTMEEVWEEARNFGIPMIKPGSLNRHSRIERDLETRRSTSEEDEPTKKKSNKQGKFKISNIFKRHDSDSRKNKPEVHKHGKDLRRKHEDDYKELKRRSYRPEDHYKELRRSDHKYEEVARGSGGDMRLRPVNPQRRSDDYSYGTEHRRSPTPSKGIQNRQLPEIPPPPPPPKERNSYLLDGPNGFYQPRRTSQRSSQSSDVNSRNSLSTSSGGSSAEHTADCPFDWPVTAANRDVPVSQPPIHRVCNMGSEENNNDLIDTSLEGSNADFIDSLRRLKDCGWYWGPLNWDNAEAKLVNKPDGSFLVRDSSDDRYILSLSFRSQGTTHHTRIEHYKGTFSFYSQPKSHGAGTIIEFIEKAMEHSRSGKFLYFLRPRAPGLPPAPVQLLYPVSRFRIMQSLQHMCRFVILKHVRYDHIDTLPLPEKIKRYLMESQYYVEYILQEGQGFREQ